MNNQFGSKNSINNPISKDYNKLSNQKDTSNDDNVIDEEIEI
jgi:hypothetical protein